ncbi:hypothetical protein CEXT_547071 [Caerostris extrusa]|uniref:Uncharacterized protein n=1 Tax=Caerostris extrusa TaxID=172846 RepID=A0AAV4PK49_CAEEX|nr:hypothetical protein CEXT_547071 [Caerostris extrusa]
MLVCILPIPEDFSGFLPSSSLSQKATHVHPPQLISASSDRVIADVHLGLDWSRSRFRQGRTKPEATICTSWGPPSSTLTKPEVKQQHSNQELNLYENGARRSHFKALFFLFLFFLLF